MSELMVKQEVMIPMRDGVKLAADIYLPKSTEARPVVLSRTPYGKHLFETFVGGEFSSQVEAQVAQGYAVVVQDVRGRFKSEGEYDYFSPAEFDDGPDTIAWIKEQPWCSGKIGMTGISYLSIAQLMTAVGNPPGLQTIMPFLGAFPATHRAPGIISVEMLLPLATLLMYDCCERRQIEIKEPGLKAAVEAQRTNMEVLMPQMMAALKQGDMGEVQELQARMLSHSQQVTDYCLQAPMSERFREFKQYAPWLQHWEDELNGDSSYWQQHDYRNRLDNLKVPMLHVLGWYEPFIIDAIQQFADLIAKEDAPRHKLVLPPTTHFNAPGLPVGEKLLPLSYPTPPLFTPPIPGSAASGDLAARWMGHWLQGKESGIENEAPITLYVMGEDVWRDENEWPLARTRWTPLYLSSGGNANTVKGDGTLAWQQSSSADADQYCYDPANPVPTLGGSNLGLTTTPGGICDQAPLAEREDILFYTTEALEQDVEVTGPVTLKLWFKTSAVDTDFHAKLVDVEPGGGAFNVCSGAVRLRALPEYSKKLAPGDLQHVAVEMGPTSYLFKAGHAIRLQLTSSDFPDMDINLNTGKSALLSDEMVVAEQAIYHDQDRPSQLVLPVIPRD